MKYLKIEDDKGYFLKEENPESYIEIDKISKDDLLNLLNKAVKSGFEMEDYQEELLGNPAHRIIYKNIYEKFTQLELNKNMFKDKSESYYKEAIEKYSTTDGASNK